MSQARKEAKKSQLAPNGLGFQPLLTTLPLFELRYLIGALRGAESADFGTLAHAVTNVQSFVVNQLKEDDVQAIREGEFSPRDFTDEDLADTLDLLDPECRKLALIRTNGVWWKDLLKLVLERLLKRALE